jgi:hypothetical protein
MILFAQYRIALIFFEIFAYLMKVRGEIALKAIRARAMLRPDKPWTEVGEGAVQGF